MMLEPRAMDQELPNDPRPPIPQWSMMKSSPTTGAGRQLARNRGLALVSAITLGAGAAGVVGAGAFAFTLASQSASVHTSASVSAVGTSNNASSGTQLSSAGAPSTTKLAPVATTGAS